MDKITVMKMKNGTYSFERGELNDKDRETYVGLGYVLTEEVGLSMTEVFAKYLNLSFDKNGNHV